MVLPYNRGLADRSGESTESRALENEIQASGYDNYLSLL